MSQASEKKIDVILWGPSQSGKSTALAAYLCDPKAPPPWLDKSAPETRRTLEVLTRTWNDLSQNRLPKTTLNFKYYDVRVKNQALISFRDMKGGNTRITNTEDIEALSTAPAQVLFVEWPSESTALSKIAVEQALRFKRDDAKLALVITKVEWYLTRLKLREFIENPLGVAQKMNMRRDFMDVLYLVPRSSIFPITVYGYSANHYPAHYRDEFGRLVPWGIRPFNVASPFEHVLNPLI